MSAVGVINGTTDINIFKTHLRSSVEKMGIENNFVLMQDNNPKHRLQYKNDIFYLLCSGPEQVSRINRLLLQQPLFTPTSGKGFY